jgi:hypothetical protein
VRAAVLVELLSCYTFRDGDTKNDMTAGVRFNDGRGYGYILNKTSTALLSALRKPTLG